MALLTFRFVTLILIALSMGMAFCHTLELPAKLQYEGALYVTIQNSLYVAFGPPNINTVQLREIVGARRPQSFGVYSNLIGAVPLRRMASQLN